jgi:hypothetical protein
MKLTHIAALALTGRYLLQPPTFKRSGRSPRTESPFRELGQFQRDFDEVFDQCQQAGWRSAMRPPALPVESHIEGDQVVIRADLPWVDPKDTRMAEGDRAPSRGARLQVRLSQRDDTFGRREG